MENEEGILGIDRSEGGKRNRRTEEDDWGGEYWEEEKGRTEEDEKRKGLGRGEIEEQKMRREGRGE